VKVDALGALEVTDLMVESAGTLSIEMDADDTQVNVAETAYIDGATLVLTFDQTPAAGTEYTLLTASNIGGEFANVDADQVTINLTYNDNSIVATVE
jgi:hypothetical protein